MTDDERRDHTYSEEGLDRLLAEVGPLMRRQERAETEEPDPPFAQPDPAFERALRDRLCGMEDARSDAEDARPAPESREHDAQHPAQTGRQGWQRRPAVWAGLAAALIALVLVSLFVAGPSGVLAVAGVLAFAAVLIVRARLGQ